MSTGGVEPGFPFISLSNADQMISITKIECGKDFSLLKLIKYRCLEWKGVLVLNCDVVQWAVIDAGA